MRTSKKSGFTLIELLVVISIISLLSSVVLSALNSARAKARDARRQSDVLQIANALALYMGDHNGGMPGGGGYAEPYPGQSNWLTVELQPYIAPTNDPLWHGPPGNEYFYYVVKPDAQWITDNGGWAYLTPACAGKNLVVARLMETSGNYRQDCPGTHSQVMIVEVKY